MAAPPVRYQSFLLRLWREDDGAPWHASIQNPTTGERLGFSTLEALFAFLVAVPKSLEPPLRAVGDVELND